MCDVKDETDREFLRICTCGASNAGIQEPTIYFSGVSPRNDNVTNVATCDQCNRV